LTTSQACIADTELGGSMITFRVSMNDARRMATIVALCGGALAAGPAVAGGVFAYEFGTAEVGLASAGYGARAQDASTAFTNPAGMTRLAGNQFLASGQLDYGRTNFGTGFGTSPGLGAESGGNAFGSNGWFLGGGAFYSHSVSRELKLGFAMTGNFGGVTEYDDGWVGRYYVQQTKLIGLSFMPSIAYKVSDKLSLGASVNAMYGYYENQVAINIPDALRPGVVVPIQRAAGDAQLKLEDNTWGWGGSLGLLYEFDPRTRVGLTWNSQINLDFSSAPDWSNLGALGGILQASGRLTSTVNVGIKVPQQVMASLFTQVNDRWALLGSIGWQQWSKFGQVRLGVDNPNNPTSLTTAIPFKDTWHFAAGAQYRLSGPWLLNFGIAYDTGFQGGTVSPALPADAAWRFGIGAQQQLSKTAFWGVAADYMYGGNLDVNLQSTTPVALGGRGNVVGSYGNVGVLFMGVYGNWTF
jgi:long-chain fatty acid transport protein